MFYNFHIVKSRGFTDCRIVGNLEQTVDVYRRRKVDELVIQDIGASRSGTRLNLQVLEIMSRHCLMPITYGGGISTLKDIERCLFVGCDKVVINTEALRRPEFIREAAQHFGKQCIVLSVDYKRSPEGEPRLYSHAGVDMNDTSVINFVAMMENYGAGEIILTSVDHDGWMNGYDLDFLAQVTGLLEVSVLANGGCGEPQHMADSKAYGASGGCTGSLFLYTQYGYQDVKEHLRCKEIQTRTH